MRIYGIIAALIALSGLLVLGFLNIQEEPRAIPDTKVASAKDTVAKDKTAKEVKKKEVTPKKEAPPKKSPIVKEWNFVNKEAQKSGWRFPSKDTVATPEGITYTQTGAITVGPSVRRLKLEAKKGQRFTVSLSAMQVEANEKIPKALKGAQLLWATDENVKAAEGKSPFKKENIVNLKADPKNPNQWTAQLSGDKWSGTVDRIMIKPIFEEYIKSPVPEGKSLEITLKGVKIEQ